MKRILMYVCVAEMVACSVGPKYVRSTISVPETFKEAAHHQVSSARDEIQGLRWWEIFKDPVLNGLEEQSAQANLNIQIAIAQYRGSLAIARGNQAALWPSINGQASSTRSQASRETARGGSGNVQNDHLVGFNAAWEADLWGRIGRQVEAGEANAQASASDLAGIRLSVQAELARQYFLLRVSDAQRHLMEDTVAAYEKSLQLTKNRQTAGVATALDVAQADTQWKTAKAQLADLGIQHNQLEHGIAILLGRSPADFSITPDKLLARPPDIPLTAPVTLLERRPDIAAAERRAAASNAQIGAAKAAFFPTLSLAASAGSEGQSLPVLFTGLSSFWSVGPGIVANLFDGGVRQSRVEQAQAASDASIVAYRQVVLQAFQEVEDSLSNLHILSQEAELQGGALAAAKRSENLTTNLYRLGTVSYLNVVVAQATALNSERVALDILARQLTASVALIKALGGGWVSPDKQG